MDQPRSSRQAHRPGRHLMSPFVLLCSVGFLGRLSYEMIRSPTTALYAKHIGAPIQVIGLLVAAVTITGIFVKFPAGTLSDLFGFRRLMQAGMLVKATAPFLYIIVATWPQLLILRFYHGLSTALYAPAASANVAKLYPEQRAHRLGIYGAAENAGVMFGPMIGAAILAAAGFSVVFIVSGAIGAAALLAVLPLPRDAPTGHRSSSVKEITSTLINGLRQIAGDGAIRLVSLMEATLYAGVGTLQAYLPLYALTVHVPVGEIGLLFGGQGVASIICRPLAGAGADHLGRRPFIIGGVILCAAMLVCLPHLGGFWSLLALNLAFGAGSAMVTPATTALIGDLVKQGDFGAAMGVFGSLWDIGHASGPLVAGFLIAALGYQIAFLVLACAILGALLVFVIGSRAYGLR